MPDIASGGPALPPAVPPTPDLPTPDLPPTPPRRRRRWPLLLFPVAVAVAVAAAVFLPPRPVAELVQPSGDAFTGTPAALWGPPEDLTVPPARSVGPFGREMVADALEDARGALIAGRVTWDRDGDAFGDRFAPGIREWIGELVTDTGRTFLVSEFRAGTAARPDVRVTGDFAFSTEIDDHGRPVLQVRTRTVWAYAFPHAGRDRPVMLSVTVDWWFPHPDGTTAEGVGMWMHLSQVDVAGADCADLRLGYLSPGEPATASGPRDDSGRIDWAAIGKVGDAPEPGPDDLCFHEG
ncbi:hypothetical protein [Phytomonospora endophytica]|uniref:Uncharacterized protein n=1 Tax=Phytomonospora endophytica TaxID=714109 RepID=A0A841FK13_9ACTN|nr:hypothetical protein [Phytomonospora endophytica]MBB6036506.1 hypothetical protein [Phytomonospora endophytica]GIG65828.1 hypothetical protein Pen01_21230 [Phytomonospora endophytica]